MEEKKVVLITGGSRGIGAECANLFASNNYNVVINYNNSKEKAVALKEKIEKRTNSKVLILKADISNENEVKKMVEEIKNNFRKLDCIVNNASISLDNTINDKTVEEFKKVIDTNLIGTFIVTKYASKLITNGSIINISSTDGIDTCYKEEMDYAASKAGIISLTKTFAKEFAPNIRVNAVAPGWIDTDMNKDMSNEFKKQETEKILLKRFGNPMEVAGVVYFLATKEASYINGTVIRVDGGY